MTGYTHRILQGCSFEAFVISCSRAFFVSTRDDDSEISERDIDPEYARQVAQLDAELAEWLKRTPTANRAILDAELERQWQAAIRYEESKTTENQSLQQMRDKVLAWNPPTSDHEPLRRFMLDQIDGSMNDPARKVEKPEPATDKDVKERIGVVVDSLTRARERLLWHLKHVDTRNCWVRALKASLPTP